MRQQSVTLLTAIGGAARLPSMVEFIQKATKKPKAEEEEEVAKMAFEVPAWSLRAMQGRQGERIMSLQDHTQKSAPSLTTTASQAAQNMLKKRWAGGEGGGHLGGGRGEGGGRAAGGGRKGGGRL